MDESIHLDEAACRRAAESMPQNVVPEETADSTFHDRLQRIQDHRTEAQDNLPAALAGLNSDLMEVELYLSAALRRSFTAAPVTTDSIEAQSGAIDLMIRLSKQVAQIANLEMRSMKAKGDVEAFPARPR